MQLSQMQVTGCLGSYVQGEDDTQGAYHDAQIRDAAQPNASDRAFRQLGHGNHNLEGA